MGNLLQQKAEILERVGNDPNADTYLEAANTNKNSIQDSFGSATDAPKTETERTAELNEADDRYNMQLALGGQNTTKNNIVSVQNALTREEAKAEEKRKEAETRTLILMQLNRDIERLETERDDLMALRDLIEKGEFDQQNREHMALLERLGINSDEFLAMSDEEQIEMLDERIEHNAEDLENKYEQRNEWTSDQRQATNANADYVQEKQNTDETFDETKGLGRVAREQEATDPVQELDKFDRAFGKLQTLPPAMRAAAEQKLFAGLSEEAKENLIGNPDYEHLFETGDSQDQIMSASNEVPQESLPSTAVGMQAPVI